MVIDKLKAFKSEECKQLVETFRDITDRLNVHADVINIAKDGEESIEDKKQ